MLFPLTAFMSPGGSEFLLIMLVLILLFGAKDAPRILRSIYTALNKIQRTAASFRYKIMYGDLHTSSTDEKPCHVEEEHPEFTAYDSENEPEAEKPDDEPKKPEPGPSD